MAKPYTVRELKRILKKHDFRFEFWTARGKGSHEMIYHPDVNGRPESFPIKSHGEGTELRRGMISAIIRRFRLPNDLL